MVGTANLRCRIIGVALRYKLRPLILSDTASCLPIEPKPPCALVIITFAAEKRPLGNAARAFRCGSEHRPERRRGCNATHITNARHNSLLDPDPHRQTRPGPQGDSLRPENRPDQHRRTRAAAEALLRQRDRPIRPVSHSAFFMTTSPASSRLIDEQWRRACTIR